MVPDHCIQTIPLKCRVADLIHNNKLLVNICTMTRDGNVRLGAHMSHAATCLQNKSTVQRSGTTSLTPNISAWFATPLMSPSIVFVLIFFLSPGNQATHKTGLVMN